ncbi:MAG: MarR family winged helix-turn-helix transcriptional regulator [Actinomycetota bacterium]
MPNGVLPVDLLRPSGALLAADAVLGRCFDVASEEVGVDPTTMDLLVRLDQADGQRLRVVDLSRQLFLSPSHMSRRVERAVGDGLVERLADPDDRRASLIGLTDHGRAQLRSFAPYARRVVDAAITTPLAADELDTLIDLLGRIEAAATHLLADSDH